MILNTLRIPAAFIVLSFCSSVLFAAAENNPESTVDADNKAFSLTDDAGNVHHFSQPAQRIVSLIPHSTELLFAVGGGDAIVGAVQYSDYPEAAKSIPRVGGYSALNIEAIVALKPDLIIAWPEGNPTRDLSRLQQLGYEIFVSDPNTYETIARNLENFATASGHKAEGEKVAADFRRQVAQLRAEYSDKKPLTVFYQVWHQPLLTQNGDTFISRAIELCGGRNVYADLDIKAPQVSIESVLEMNPDVIVASGMGESRPDWLDAWGQYQHLTAVKTNSLYHIHPDLLHRPTPRFLLGTRQLCEAMEKTRKKQQSPED